MWDKAKYYSPLKRKEILTHAIKWMNLEDIIISEISPLFHNKKLNIVGVHSYNKVLWLPGVGGWENGELFNEYSFTSTR